MSEFERGCRYISKVDRPDREKGGAWTYAGPAATEGLHLFVKNDKVFVFSNDGWEPEGKLTLWFSEGAWEPLGRSARIRVRAWFNGPNATECVVHLPAEHAIAKRIASEPERQFSLTLELHAGPVRGGPR